MRWKWMEMVAPTWGLGEVLMICGVIWNDFEEVWLQCCSRAWARVRVSVGVAVQDLEVAAIEAIAAGPLCQRPTCLTDLLSETLFR
jgi:hypothetical protein